jgi:hypothetical protein
MGPKPQNLVIWENTRERPQIIIGTYSSADGNQEKHNGTHDRQAYLISVDSDGKTNWVTPMGEYYTGIRVFLNDLNNSGGQYLYAHKYTSSRLREDEGSIYNISKSGKILQRFDTRNSILSAAAASSDSNGEVVIYAADSKMILYRLDHRLNLLQKKSLAASSSARECRIVGVHDYNGDGRNEILLYFFERLMSDKNPLEVNGPKGKVFYSNLIFQIYAQDFSSLIKSITLSEGWEKQHGFAVTDINRPEGRHYPFMALSHKITVYNY